MGVLFVCNTYYQLIVAIQMQLTLKKEDNVSVVLTDVSNGSERVYRNLQAAGIFDQVYYLKTGEKSGKTSLTYLREGVIGLSPDGMARDAAYDEMIGFNYDLSTCALFARLEKTNRDIRCNVMEEGLLSYATPDSDCRVAKLIRMTRKLLSKKNAREKRKYFYCFNKRAYQGHLVPIEIPAISQNDVRFQQALSDAFLGGKRPESYQEKYIYLSSVYDFEGGKPVGEIEVAMKVAEVVGYDNLIVKAHPRDDAQRFKKAGLKVAENSAIPWEVFQIGCDFSDKVLISGFSGSLINLNGVVENGGRSVYVTHMCDIGENPMAQHFAAMIDGYIGKAESYGLKNIETVSSVEEII